MAVYNARNCKLSLNHEEEEVVVEEEEEKQEKQEKKEEEEEVEEKERAATAQRLDTQLYCFWWNIGCPVSFCFEYLFKWVLYL